MQTPPAPVPRPPRRDDFIARPASATSNDRTFIERLYRSAKSYADRLSQDELEGIHVDLGVDDYLVEEAGRNRQIIVTGNPEMARPI